MFFIYMWKSVCIFERQNKQPSKRESVCVYVCVCVSVHPGRLSAQAWTGGIEWD